MLNSFSLLFITLEEREDINAMVNLSCLTRSSQFVIIHVFMCLKTVLLQRGCVCLFTPCIPNTWLNVDILLICSEWNEYMLSEMV